MHQNIRMAAPDQFDEIAASVLVSDVELALTFLRAGLSQPEGERRKVTLDRAALSYKRICESICLVRMTDADLVKLTPKLEELGAALRARTVIAHRGC